MEARELREVSVPEPSRDRSSLKAEMEELTGEAKSYKIPFTLGLQTARNAAQFCDVFLFEFCIGHIHLRVKRGCGWMANQRLRTPRFRR